MAIIRYQLESGSIPSYISDGGYFARGNDKIGIGSGGGTVLSKSELLSYVLSQHASSPYRKPSTSWLNTASGDLIDMTNAEVTTLVNDWCTARGVS